MTSPLGDGSVTVIIVNWNSGPLLQQCLQHLQAQTRQPDQVLLVDNASTDGSAASPPHWPPLQVLHMQDNLGFAAGNNRALALCKTEYVALLNPDAFAHPQWLQALLQAAQAHPHTAAFGSRQLCAHDPARLDGTGDCYHISGAAWRRGHGRRQTPADLRPREIFAPCAAAALYRRDALDAAGGFDESYFCYMEDVDLGFRLRLLGHHARYAPQAIVHHVGSATTGGQRSAFALLHGHRNMVWTFVKNMPAPLLALLLPAHLLANAAAIVLATLRGHPWPVLKAKWQAIQALPAVLRQRRTLQRKAVASALDIWRALDKRPWPRR